MVGGMRNGREQATHWQRFLLLISTLLIVIAIPSAAAGQDIQTKTVGCSDARGNPQPCRETSPSAPSSTPSNSSVADTEKARKEEEERKRRERIKKNRGLRTRQLQEEEGEREQEAERERQREQKEREAFATKNGELSNKEKGLPNSSNKELTTVTKAGVRIGAATGIRGAVRVIRGSGNPWLLKSGIAIRMGDRVITGPNSRVQMRFDDDTVLTMGPNSDLAMDDFGYNPAPATETRGVVVSLVKGFFRFVTGKIAMTQPSNMKVKLPVGCLGHRGTDYRVTIRSSDDGSVAVYDGSIEVTEDKTNRVFLMEAGQMVSFSASGFGVPRKFRLNNKRLQN